METIVVSHNTALYAIRRSRRRYAYLPWEQLARSQQQRALDACTPNGSGLDLDELERLGVWDSSLGCVDVLVGSMNSYRHHGLVRQHLLSKPLPSNSLLKIAEGVYAASPALALVQYAEDHPWQEVLGLAFELCGTFSLVESPVNLTPAPHAVTNHSFPDLDGQEDAWPDTKSQGRSALGYFAGEPVLTCSQLNRYVSYAKDIHGLPCARKAARYALDGAASPMEAIMAGMFHAPKSVGGFGVKDLLLNYRMDFDHDAVLASGMAHAVLDAYIRSAKATMEYNGHCHDAIRSRIHDEKRTAGLQAMGILTIPVNDEQLQNLDALEAMAKTLYKQMGTQFRYTTDGYRQKQAELLNALRKQMGLKPC